MKTINNGDTTVFMIPQVLADLTGKLSTGQLPSGGVPVSNISATGTASSSTYLRGDGSWNAPSGGGSANTAQATVDFGTPTPQDTTMQATVAATWVTANSVLMCAVVEGLDHTDDEIAAEQITSTVGNIIPGVSLDVVVSAPNGASGKFLVNVVGF